jgi:hypothetical protein
VSVQPRYRAFAGTATVVVIAAVLLGSTIALVATPPAASAFGAQLLPEDAPCPGAVLPHNYSGVLAVDGHAGGSSVALSYSYAATVTTNTTAGAVFSSACVEENGTVATSENGSFALSIDPIPDIRCTTGDSGSSGQCVSTEGPYELVSLAPASPIPPGYYDSVVQNGTTFEVNLYPFLGSVVLTPGGPEATFSVGARDGFQATPLTGAGTPTPGSMVPTYAWSLSGVGWTFLPGTRDTSVNVTAAPGAGVGNLSVVASLAVNGGTLTTSPSSVELVAAATTIASASLNRTALDVGQSVRVVANGSGASGYPYSLTLHPGLGEPNATVPCSVTAGAEGSAALACAIAWNYTSVGESQPVATVSNGYSTAAWPFPIVTVNADPSIAVTPSAPVGYANATLPITVGVSSDTGTLPYRQACLGSGSGPPECLDTPGPTWSFGPVYSAPGRYTATAWTVDATGENRSTSVGVRIVAPLRVALSTNVTDLAVGTPIVLDTVVGGGDLPAQVWWNASGSETSGATERVSVDGPLELDWVPSASGALTISVTVADSLGTLATATESWVVGVGAATAVVPVVLPATSPVRAGAPVSIGWQALDAANEAVHDFASAAEIELLVAGSDRTAGGWVNASGIGPLASPLPGWFDVPENAWIGGALNASVTSRVAGSIQVDLVVAAGLPGAGRSVTLEVLPDIDRLHLWDPRVVLAEARANDTLWQVADRFGNPATGGSVVTTTWFNGVSERTETPILSEPNGTTDVWVNYTAPALFAGTVTITDLAGDVLVAPIAVAGISGAWSVLLSEMPLPAGFAAGVIAGSIALLRARRGRAVIDDTAGEDDEIALQRLAEGRESVVEVVRRAGPLDLAGLAVSWTPPPAPPDLADWVASLLTDGTLNATFGDDGVARFCLANAGPAPERVVVDVDAFDRAQRRRTEARAEWDRDDP